MSYSIQCPECKAEWIPLDKVSHEFKFNLLKAENARYRKALEKITSHHLCEYGCDCGNSADQIARDALEGKE